MNDLSFVVSEIRRHFTSWMEHSTKSFDVKWVGEQLVLTTDSVDLIQLWWNVEREYVEHILDLDLLEACQEENLDYSNDLFFLPAA
jgi:hypothetical protein